MNDEQQDALGRLARIATMSALSDNPWKADNVMPALREMWPDVPDYWRRQILCDVEVALLRIDTKPLACVEEWRKLLADLTPPKAPFTVTYRCGKCSAEGVKLWRGAHGCKNKDGHELLCARCLAPDVDVDDEGRAPLDLLHGAKTDQVANWLPAVPVGDTFWGYSSVPSADVKWWQALPTYAR